ncbi:branched-chain amino acid ABC transporter permease [Saliphagus sp. GCM10025334]
MLPMSSIVVANISQYALNGLSTGMILFLMATGLTLIFGLIGLINFAHGVLFTLGGYLTMVISTSTGSYWIGIIAGMFLVGAFGLVLERSLLHHLYDKPLLGFLATFGIWLVLEELVLFNWGGQSYSVVSPLSGSIDVLGTSYPTHRLFIIVVGLVVAVVFGAILNYTRLGLEIHATAVDQPTAEILGVQTSKIYSITFFTGVVLAAFAGGLIAPVTSVYPSLGTEYMLFAFLIVMVGGLGSFLGSFFVSLAIGLIISFGSLYIAPTYVTIGIFAIAMGFILFKPRGLFGTSGVME